MKKKNPCAQGEGESRGDKVGVCWYDQSSYDVSGWWTKKGRVKKTRRKTRQEEGETQLKNKGAVLGLRSTGGGGGQGRARDKTEKRGADTQETKGWKQR